MCGEGEEARIVDGLLPLPAQHDGLLAVVVAVAAQPPKRVKALLVAVHERVEVAPM